MNGDKPRFLERECRERGDVVVTMEVADTRKRKKGKGESRWSAGCRLPVATRVNPIFLIFIFSFPNFFFFLILRTKLLFQ
ncbi:hypothetical protein EUGRSUZ_G00992 [Eucalyptus grandis]|uniref:Uncharacterized protein n=2 Tax=Eucalyptus grandis TaxID=71139 RepID=A0ACC3K2M3_EUCGR|nr:hypothetical protein EUGRSUZ_G00992 [Eucalyptus grandis]